LIGEPASDTLLAITPPLEDLFDREVSRCPVDPRVIRQGHSTEALSQSSIEYRPELGFSRALVLAADPQLRGAP
jgi:hypothetical protein